MLISGETVAVQEEIFSIFKEDIGRFLKKFYG